MNATEILARETDTTHLFDRYGIEHLSKLYVINRVVNPELIKILLKLKNIIGCYAFSAGGNYCYIGKSKNLFLRICTSYYENFLFRKPQDGFLEKGKFVCCGLLDPYVSIYFPVDESENNNLEKYLIAKYQPTYNRQFRDLPINDEVPHTGIKHLPIYTKYLL